jgi:2-polyprenyl-3-methyl-5-hydroxy-6-metoxy-1,4-benzoquinol methylase
MMKNIDIIKRAVIEIWPAHQKFLEQSEKNDNPDQENFREFLAHRIVDTLGTDLRAHVTDYKTMCDGFLEEEIYFRRNGQYRNNSFREVQKFVYDNPSYMQSYMNGLLISSVLFHNHYASFEYFTSEFLNNRPMKRYLEIGPGHGLGLWLACQREGMELFALDVSQRSISRTKSFLSKANVDTNSIDFIHEDILKFKSVENGRFDAIVISEVLEHLEDPVEALKKLYELLSFDGSLFLNVPFNSPAIDHLFLYKVESDIVHQISSAGFVIESKKLFPGAGKTLEQAAKLSTAVSFCAILKKGA